MDNQIKTKIGTFDKNNIYVLNLEKRGKRLEKFKNSCLKEKIPYTRFKGIRPTEEHATKYKNLLLTDYYSNYIKNTGKYGYLGATLAHTKLWLHIIKTKNNNAIIFEDDAIIEENFVEKLNHKLNYVPDDWDIILVGFLCQYRHWHKCHDNDNQKVNDHVWKINCFYGPTCYIVNTKKLKGFMKKLLPYDWHWEVYISKMMKNKDFKVYGIKNPLITHPGKCYVDSFNFYKHNKFNGYESDTETERKYYD